MFPQNLIAFKEPEVHETENGRFYTFDGASYPSITTILSRTADKSTLDAWKARVGEEEANRISRQSTKHGSELHLLMENFVCGHEIPKASFKSQQVFNLLRPVISKRVTTIYGCESPLYSHSLKVAGRTDLVCDFDGVPSILDWKTVKLPGVKKEEFILDYRLQGTFYGTCVNEGDYPIKIQQGVLVFCNPWGIAVDKFDINDYTSSLRERVNTYYSVV